MSAVVPTAAIVLSYTLAFLEQLPKLIEAGVEVKGLIQEHTAKVKAMRAEDRPPTEEEWALLNGQVERLRNELHEKANPD